MKLATPLFPVLLGDLAKAAFALALIGCVTHDVDPPEVQSAARTAIKTLGPTQVRLEQIVYAHAGTETVSAWGAMTIDPSILERTTGISSGFVSAFADGRWLAINIAVSAQTDQYWPTRIAERRLPAQSFVPPVRVPVALGSAQPMSLLAAQIVVTTQPLTPSQLSTLESQPHTTFAIAPYVEDHTPGLALEGPGPGGMPPNPSLPGSYQMPKPPPKNSYLPAELPPESPDSYVPVGEHWELSQPHEYNVNSAKNQCGIVALANNLAYLRQWFDLPVPDYLQKGIVGMTTLPGRLDGYGSRPVTSTCAGGGIASCADDDSGGLLNALYGYVEHRVGFETIALRHQGLKESYPSACAALPGDGPVSNREGTEVTFEWVCDRIAHGDAVILGVGYYDYDVDGPAYPGAPIKQVGGHGVRVYGCGETYGQRFLRILDDDQQDGMFTIDDDEEKVCTEREGLAWEYWPVSDLNDDGKLNAKNDLFTQLIYAIAIEPL